MKNESELFRRLLCFPAELELALKENPDFITELDENGETFLHHVARMGCLMGTSNALKILEVLFSLSNINFNIKDINGNTPLHLAALYCSDRVTCKCVFPALIKKASECGFDFSTLGQGGQSVLHIAAKVSYVDRRRFFEARVNSVLNVIKNVKDPGLNVLSSSGSTALYYAINHLHFEEAESLLDAGANPGLCGSSERNPFTMIEELIAECNKQLSGDKISKGQENLKWLKDKLDGLYKKMLSIQYPSTPVQISFGRSSVGV